MESVFLPCKEGALAESAITKVSSGRGDVENRLYSLQGVDMSTCEWCSTGAHSFLLEFRSRFSLHPSNCQICRKLCKPLS